MLKGSAVALVTPMKPMVKLIGFDLENLLNGISIKAPRYRFQLGRLENLQPSRCGAFLIRSAVEAAAGRVPIIAGTGANSTLRR